MSFVTTKGRYILILNNPVKSFFSSFTACIAGASVLFQLSGCSSRTGAGCGTRGDAVACVNGTAVSAADLDFEIDYYNSAFPEGAPGRIGSLSGKADYLKEEVVQRLLISQEAQRRGFDKKEEFKRLMEKTRQEILVLLFIEQETGGFEPSEEEAEEYYRGYKTRLSNLEERHVREILVSAEKEAQDILIRLLQGEDFAVMAASYSIAASRSNGGDAGFLKKGKRSFSFDKAVFSPGLHEGDISSVFSCPEGFYIVKIEEIRRFQGRPFEELRGEIRNILLQEKKQKKVTKLLQELKSNSRVEIHEGRIR